VVPVELESPSNAYTGEQNEPLDRIVVEPRRQTVDVNGRPTPLQAGIAVGAYVLQKSRAINQWMLELLLGVNGVTRSHRSNPCALRSTQSADDWRSAGHA
jgi:hypothetical protein